jgi:hypothetical protein
MDNFLAKIQTILDKGGFVATYKLCLLQALVNLADKGSDTLSTREIAEEYLALYWQQVAPYQGSVLKQNSGKQAAIINAIADARANGVSPADEKAWHKLVKKVEQTVKVMPLWRLQTVGKVKDTFLYENVGKGSSITLKPGVVASLVEHRERITQMAQAAWVHHVCRFNNLDNPEGLPAFLFGHAA